MFGTNAVFTVDIYRELGITTGNILTYICSSFYRLITKWIKLYARFPLAAYLISVNHF